MAQGQSRGIKAKALSLGLDSVGLPVGRLGAGVGAMLAREVTRSDSLGIPTLLDNAGKL